MYDNLGLLKYVIPPIEVATFTSGTRTLASLQKYCYYTEYDKHLRPYKQYVPGAGYTIILYDKRDRLVLSQSAKLRSRGQWAFTKYDILDRPLITGVCQGTEATHTAGLLNQTIFGETKTTIPGTRSSYLSPYTNITYPTSPSINDYLSMSFYDDYTWIGQLGVPFSSSDAIGIVKNDRVVGMLTGTKHKVLGAPYELYSNEWLTSAVYLDVYLM